MGAVTLPGWLFWLLIVLLVADNFTMMASSRVTRSAIRHIEISERMIVTLIETLDASTKAVFKAAQGAPPPPERKEEDVKPN